MSALYEGVQRVAMKKDLIGPPSETKLVAGCQDVRRKRYTLDVCFMTAPPSAVAANKVPAKRTIETGTIYLAKRFVELHIGFQQSSGGLCC